MKGCVAAILALGSLATAIGCGDDSKDSKGASGVESKPPQEVLDQAAAALGRVKTFHIEGTQGIGKRSTTAKADVGLPSKLRLAVTQGSASASIVVVDGSLYVKANAAFWKQERTGKAAGALAGHWFKTPTTTGGLRDLTKSIDPKVLSRCLATDHGTLARGGTATVDGERAIVIVDKGDRPGTAPGKLYVAASGEPLPLRVITTGAQRPGGKRDPLCDGEDDTPARAGDEFVFSDYDEPLDVSAPPAAVDLGGGAAS